MLTTAASVLRDIDGMERRPNRGVKFMRSKLVIWGAGGHALVVADIVRLRGDYEIVGFLDDANPQRHETEFCGASILGGREQLDALKLRGVQTLIFAFGHHEMRLRLSEFARAKGFSLATAVHPQAIVAADVDIGTGTVLVAGAVVNPSSKVGQNVIINTCASIDHECVVEDGAHIGPGARLAGRVVVGRAAQIGIGAKIVGGVRIGAGSLIGAGAVVLNDIPEGVVAYGSPAKVVRRVKTVD
jgi:acetyltransferase EpsM